MTTIIIPLIIPCTISNLFYSHPQAEKFIFSKFLIEVYTADLNREISINTKEQNREIFLEYVHDHFSGLSNSYDMMFSSSVRFAFRLHKLKKNSRFTIIYDNLIVLPNDKNYTHIKVFTA